MGYFAALPEDQRALKIIELDQRVPRIGHKVLNPGYWPTLVLLIIRLGEMRSVRKVIEILE